MRSVLIAVVTAIITSMAWLVSIKSGLVTAAPEARSVAPDASADVDTNEGERRSVAEEGLDEGDTIQLSPRMDPSLRRARSVEIGPRGLAVPVAGVTPAQLVDTFTAARAGGARRHDAIDIMADTGIPVVAAAPGILEKIYYSEGGGGKTLYVRSGDKNWIYYYAHLADYAAGLEQGQRVERGGAIGTVGSTGNANADAPHLHFAIHRMTQDESWHEGRPVNPYPLLAGNDEDG